MALAPVSSSERVPVLDVVRGLALYGVLTANVAWIFSGLELLPPKQVDANNLAGFYVNMFVSGRAISTLTILFGLGFAIQMARAEERGEEVRGVFVRRLLAMLMFGFAHLLLLWWGDILWSYAVAGFGMLWFRRCGVRKLLVWSVALMFVPRLIGAVPEVRAAIMAVVPQPASDPAFNAELLTVLAGDDRLAMTWAHLRKIVYHEGRILVWFWPWILGHFLLGMAAGKARVFENDGAGHHRLFRWMLVISIALTVIMAVVMTAIRPSSREAMMALPLIARLGMITLNELVTLGVVAFYISAVVLLMQRRIPRRLLMIVAPVGRMPLTTYLSQSVFATFVFYGWGLGWIGEVTLGEAVAIAAGIFVVQVVIAHLVLRRFRSGPMEWLWRKLAYRGRSRGGDVQAPAAEAPAAVPRTAA
jgi:uncharacterized protein